MSSMVSRFLSPMPGALFARNISCIPPTVHHIINLYLRVGTMEVNVIC